MRDQTLSWVEWEWAGRHLSCQRVTRGPPDRELRQGHPETVDWSGTSTVRDVWSRELCGWTCEPLHPSVSEPEIGWTPYPDRQEIWSAG